MFEKPDVLSANDCDHDIDRGMRQFLVSADDADSPRDFGALVQAKICRRRHLARAGISGLALTVVAAGGLMLFWNLAQQQNALVVSVNSTHIGARTEFANLKELELT